MPLGHREETLKLTEGVLLAGLGGDRLKNDLSGGTGIHVREEAIDTSLTPASECLAEVDEFADSGEGVLVFARLRGGGAEHVGDCGSVANFLIRHMLD